MTADNTNETGGVAQDQGSAGKSRGRKAARKRSATARSTAAKRGGSTASRRAASSRASASSDQGAAGRGRSSRSGGKSASRRSGSSSGAGGGLGARLLARAGRAIPLASRGIADQRIVQRLADERPYMLGALGLGIGAMIGLMLPGTLSSMTGRSRRGRNSR